jgi:MGTC/SAPB C-terminal domain
MSTSRVVHIDPQHVNQPLHHSDATSGVVGMGTGSAVVMGSPTSEDINGTGVVEICADLLSSGRQDAALEQIVNRLSLEPA